MSDAIRMLDKSPTGTAKGCGPNAGGTFSQEDYHHPAAGWGAAMSVGLVLLKQHELIDGTRVVFKMNHEDGGYDCPGCAWPDDRHGLSMDICENGIKHATWELTRKKATPDFFAAHTVAELSGWSDFALEDVGRLTEPMRYDAASDKYVPVSWDDAFAMIGRHLRGLASPNQAAFYTSGRLNNEATFLYQLWARELGTNNLPDCSNMCHEASGRALQAALGTGKGTCDLVDWQKTACLIVMGVNAASNAPRMLTSLAEAYRRGASIVHVNPLVEAAARRTIVPHDILRMATFQSTRTSTLNVQPRIAGDMALMRGVAKHLFEAVATDPKAIDREFIERYTAGFEAYRSLVEATPWAEIELQSGVPEATVREMGEVYRKSRSAVISWCLGVTQQEHAADTIRELVNVLLLRGNIGREGSGPCPIRGHSNVQGNRTCGIDHRPTEDWLARLDSACGIASPRSHGLDTVRVIPAMMRGEVKVFIGMGGNFALAAPDTAYTFPALRNCELTVHVSTKLNRSHIVHGRDALILPCLGRTEKDHGKKGLQGVTVEDSMSMVHLSFGMKDARSPHLHSEVAIIAGMADASLPGTQTPWADYAGEYDLVRDKMAEALEGFEDFNRRVRQPLGFRLKQPARELVFLTDSGKANFSAAPLADVAPAAGRLLLGTMRSHDQWNTTIYSDDDRYRGVKNLRTLVFMNREDMRERSLAKYDLVDITSFAKDGSTRSARGYRALPYNLPRGSAMGYMPELNVLCPIGDYSPQSDQPLMKHVIVEITPIGGGIMIRICHKTGVASVEVGRVTGSLSAPSTDELSVEEPLEIRLAAPAADAAPTPLAVTMRTPGDDVDLAAGFLFTEGIIAGAGDIEGVRRAGLNAVEARLRPGVALDAARLDRHSFVSSSCGACGKRSIAAVRVASRQPIISGVPRLAPGVIHGLPRALRAGQTGFARTGGIHASGLFDAGGRLLALREDVGRHNALDKLIGSELLAGRIPLAGGIVLVSGRVSFELVQKAAIAGVPVLGAVGAPSSLAVELARECGMTLLGFVRDARFNVYSDSGRIDPAGTLTHSA